MSDSKSETYSDEEDHIQEDSDQSEEDHSLMDFKPEACTSDEDGDYDSDESY